MTYEYEKLDENMEVQYCPQNDYDGSVTGHIVMNVKAWFDEHPEERIRRGWIKHIHNDEKEVADYDPQTQYLVTSVNAIDDYTVEDVYHVLDKSEDMMLLEEMLESLGWTMRDKSGFTFF